MPKADSVKVSNPAVKTVAIVGAGLGGLAVAIALQAQGIHGSPTALVNLKKENGDLIAQTPMALREQYHQPMLDIRWSRLQAILAARCCCSLLRS